MERDELISALERGETIRCGSALHRAIHGLSQETLRITAELDGGCHGPDEVRRLLSELTGREVDATVAATCTPHRSGVETMDQDR